MDEKREGEDKKIKVNKKGKRSHNDYRKPNGNGKG